MCNCGKLFWKSASNRIFGHYCKTLQMTSSGGYYGLSAETPLPPRSLNLFFTAAQLDLTLIILD